MNIITDVIKRKLTCFIIDLRSFIKYVQSVPISQMKSDYKMQGYIYI